MNFLSEGEAPEQPEAPKAEAAPAAEQPAPAEPEADPATQAKPEQADQPKAEAKSKQQTIEEMAAQYGLDPKNAAHRKILTDLAAATKRNSDKDQYIDQLRSGSLLGDLMGGEDTEQPPAPPEPAKANPSEQPKAAAPGQPVFGDIGDAWKRPEDGQTALIEALNAGDVRSAHEIQQAMFVRNMAQFGPVLTQMVNHMLEQRIGPLEPIVKAQRDSAAQNEGLESARTQVMGLSDGRGEMFRSMTKPDNPEPLEVDGQRLPNTPLNRILMEYPHILKLREQHANPKEAARLTALAQYEAAMTIYHRQQQQRTAAPEAGQKLVQAGKQLAEKQAQEQTRQQMNAGKTSAASAAGKKSFLDDFGPQDGRISAQQLWK